MKIIVDFSADWCGPCRFIAPKFESLSQQYSEIFFVKINIDNAKLDCLKTVTGVPAFRAICDGNQVGEDVVGANELALTKLIENLRSQPLKSNI